MPGYYVIITFDINLSIIEIKISSIVIGYSIKTRVMSKKWKKKNPPQSPRGWRSKSVWLLFYFPEDFPDSLDLLC